VSGRKLVFDLTDEAFQRLHPHPPQAVPLPLLGEGLMRIILMIGQPLRLASQDTSPFKGRSPSPSCLRKTPLPKGEASKVAHPPDPIIAPPSVKSEINFLLDTSPRGEGLMRIILMIRQPLRLASQVTSPFKGRSPSPSCLRKTPLPKGEASYDNKVLLL